MHWRILRTETWNLSHRPDIELLIACALPPSHPEIGDRIRSSAGSPIDWNKLCELAAYHRVEPLLYQRLSRYAPSLAPENILAELAARNRAGATRNLNLTGELISLTKTFTAAGIPILPHKGPLLALAAYGDLAMRQFADLDILVHPADLPRAIATLAQRDYRPAEDLAWLSPSALLRWTGEMSYTSPSGVSVDLHWRLTPSHYPVQLDPEILWHNRTSVTIAGASLPTLTPEALVLLLAVHGAKHCWEAMGWLADVAWLLDANPRLQWAAVHALAAEARCERVVALAESLINAVFRGAALDSDLCRRVLDRWQNQPAESPRSPELLRFAASLSERPTTTLRHVCGLILHPTEIDWRTRRLPESRFWLYAPARVARLARKYLLRG